MKVMEVSDLSVVYGDTEVLSGVTFDLTEGDYLGIVGPNGSGKTTLIRCILGLIPAASGAVRLLGKPKEAFAEWYRIGYVPQVSADGRHKGFPATVAEIVASGLLSRKRFPKRLTRRDGRAVEDVLDTLGIRDLGGKMIGRLSGGQRQRVFLARALVSNPQILFLDEPTAALDPETRERFYETLRTLNQRANKTIVIITHDSATIGKYAAKLLCLDRRVVFFGSLEDFCMSEEMGAHFGEYAQHVMCHRHNGSGLVR